MESKLLHELYCVSLIPKQEIVLYLKEKEPHIENIDYYDIIYLSNQDNEYFVEKLNKICCHNIFENELKEKYQIIITLFHRNETKLDIKKVLYYFFSKNRKELLDIDFDFWNLVETDWELKQDGFEGITNSLKEIKEYLKKKSFDDKISNLDLIFELSKL